MARVGPGRLQLGGNCSGGKLPPPPPPIAKPYLGPGEELGNGQGYTE